MRENGKFPPSSQIYFVLYKEKMSKNKEKVFKKRKKRKLIRFPLK